MDTRRAIALHLALRSETQTAVTPVGLRFCAISQPSKPPVARIRGHSMIGVPRWTTNTSLSRNSLDGFVFRSAMFSGCWKLATRRPQRGSAGVSSLAAPVFSNGWIGARRDEPPRSVVEPREWSQRGCAGPRPRSGQVIVVAPIKLSPGHFQARLETTNELLVGSSRQPFLDAARVLIKNGHDPYAVLLMKHAGSDIVALKAPLAKAAKLGVEEGPNGPRFVPFRTGPSVAAPSIAPSTSAASTPPRSSPLTGAPATQQNDDGG
jgi:hypothetical protein